MKIGEGQDVTPGGGEEANFFAQFMPDEDSGLQQEGSGDDEPDAGGDEDGQDDGGQPDEGGQPDDQGGVEPEPDEPNDNPDDGGGDEPDPEPEDGGDDSGSDDDANNPYGSIMQSLVDNEVFDVVDEDRGYTPDEEGFKQLVEDTVNNRLDKAVEEKMAGRSEQIVEIENFLNDNEGATLDDYINEQQDFDYNTVDETNPQYAVYLLEDFYKLQGYKPDEIKETLKEHQEAKSISRHAKKAKAALVKYQEEALQTKREAREARVAQEKAEAVEQNRQLEQRILKTEKIAGIPLSPKERQELADYILKPVDEGKRTKMMLDEVEKQDAALIYALIMKNNLDLSKLEQKAETKATLKFKKQINKHTDKLAKPNKSRSTGTRDADDGDLSGLDAWKPMGR